MKLPGLALVLSLAACGGHTPATQSPDPMATATTAGPASTAALTITDLKFYDHDNMGLQLHSDGRIEILVAHSEGGRPAETSWHEVGTLKSDGTLTGKDGKSGQLLADGTFKGPKGETVPFKLVGDALVLGDNKKVTIDDKGVFQLDGKVGGSPMRVEGAADAGSRRAALLIVGLLMTGSKDEAAAAPAVETPAKAP